MNTVTHCSSHSLLVWEENVSVSLEKSSLLSKRSSFAFTQKLLSDRSSGPICNTKEKHLVYPSDKSSIHPSFHSPKQNMPYPTIPSTQAINRSIFLRERWILRTHLSTHPPIHPFKASQASIHPRKPSSHPPK